MVSRLLVTFTNTFSNKHYLFIEARTFALNKKSQKKITEMEYSNWRKINKCIHIYIYIYIFVYVYVHIYVYINLYILIVSMLD